MAERKKKEGAAGSRLASFGKGLMGNVRRNFGDPLVSLGKGAVGLNEALVGLGDMVTNGRVGRFLEEKYNPNVPTWLGYRPDEARRFLDSLYSPEQQAANANVENARGFVNTAGAMITNPSTLAHSGIESAPVVASALLGGGGAAGLARLGASQLPNVAGKLASPVGQASSRLAGASAAEGMYGAAQEAQRIQREGYAPLTDRPADIMTRGAIDSAIGLAGRAVAPSFRAMDNFRVQNMPLGENMRNVINDAAIRDSVTSNSARAVRGVIGESGAENAMQTGVEGMGFMPATRREREEEERKRRTALQPPSR